jgi:Ran GTPase-activating protein (RanGAP) involved in mRNA processing and transport
LKKERNSEAIQLDSQNTILDIIQKDCQHTKYEVADQGKEYLRSAIKMTVLKNVLHLSLPDNLLGIGEAKLIAGMIKKNYPLRILNLQNNNLCHKSGLAIGDALQFNTNLKSLDLSYNRLGDCGIRNLLSY